MTKIGSTRAVPILVVAMLIVTPSSAQFIDDFTRHAPTFDRTGTTG